MDPMAVTGCELIYLNLYMLISRLNRKESSHNNCHIPVMHFVKECNCLYQVPIIFGALSVH
jgi:hypothetical protein